MIPMVPSICAAVSCRAAACSSETDAFGFSRAIRPSLSPLDYTQLQRHSGTTESAVGFAMLQR